jgi:hypothetical protein
MKGCVLAGRFRFADPSKNRPQKNPAPGSTEVNPAGDDSKQ